jgi:ligand-binding SRPBCC domain-containing protein
LRRLEFKLFVPATMDVVWDFFSSPANLAKITPPEMGFFITSPAQQEMYPGMFITYKVSPVLGIRLKWVTEITQLSFHKFFIDEQRRGPYSIWHHEHHFKEVNGGVEMRDILYYSVPFGFLGNIVDWIFVRRKIYKIFNFREKRIKGIFPAKK